MVGATPDSFRAKASRENCSMVYRELDCALRFIERLDEAVARFEQEAPTLF